jgi:hypothetical protein
MARYNVVRDYDWTSAPKGAPFRNNAPKIWLKSYKINSNQIMSAINGYIAIGSGSAEEFYDKLYGESATAEDDFYFPYFSDGIRSFGNTFGDTFQSANGGSGGTLSDMFEGSKTLVGGAADLYNVAKTAWSGLGDLNGVHDRLNKGGSPGSYIETPMFYQYEKNDSDVEVVIILANTINENAYSDNMNLINKLTTINRPLRKTSISVEPPRIYQIRVNGLRFVRWAYCNHFNATMLGMKREIGGAIVPEAYQLTMTFKSLTMEHAGFMDKIK